MSAHRVRLGVDFGTSNTIAALAWPNGAAKPLVFDGSELLPSAVCLDPAAGLLVGRDAMHAARRDPACYEPNPKRRIDEGSVLLGTAEVPVVELFAAVLRRVAAEAGRVAGGAVSSVTLTGPAGWGPWRREVLLAAARVAGLGTPLLVAEPVAAAWYFVEVLGSRVPVGSSVVVYDFGGGTFDASVLRRTAAGFEVLAEAGLPDVGGLDVDAAIVAHLGREYASRGDGLWQRLVTPTSAADRRACRLLWDDVRTGKEMLSRASSTYIHIPLLDVDAPLGRAEFDRITGPLLERTVATTQAALRRAGVAGADIAGLFLVGGSSRIPLASTLLLRELGVAPTVLEQPELVVAAGSLRARPEPPSGAPGPLRPAGPGPQASPPRPAPPVAQSPPPAPPVAQSAPPRPAPPVAPVRPPMVFTGHNGAVYGVAFGLDGTVVASAGKDATVRAWNVASRWPVCDRPTGHGQPVVTAAFSPHGHLLATAGGDQSVRLWDVAGQRPLGQLPGNGHEILGLAFSPDGRLLATASGDECVRLWELPHLRMVAECRVGGGFGLAFSPDGRLLATAGWDRSVRLWEVPGLRPSGAALTGHTDAVRSVAFSPDARILASAGRDGTVRLWDPKGRQSLGEPLTGHTGTVRSVAFSPDARILASAGRDGTVRLWDPTSRQSLGEPLTGHAGSVNSVAFGPGGRTLATAGRDRTVRLWDISDRRR